MRPLSEVAMFTQNVGEVADLIAAVTGLEPEYRSQGIAVFKHQGVAFLIHRAGGESDAGPPNVDHIAFASEDLDRTYQELTEKGFEFELPPQTYDWGRSAYLRDADGRMIEIQEKTE
ncbi:MAG: VOC family protein [Anaerolineales bacterium]|nr:VOC family protein [Anaerolineales bacterium]